MQRDFFKPGWETMSKRARRDLRLALQQQDHRDIQQYQRLQEQQQRAVNAVNYRSNLAINTDRGPSSAIWADYPQNEYIENPSHGIDFFDDFTRIGNMGTSASAIASSLPPWMLYGDAGAVQSDGAGEGGVLTLGVDGDNENISLGSSTGSFRFLTTSTLLLNQKMWFETRIKKSTITTATVEVFVGLCTPSLSSNLPAADIPLTDTADTLSTTPSFFGFHLAGTTGNRGGPTEVGVAFELAAGTVNYPTNLTAIMASSGNSVLAANTFVKLGWVFDPNGPVRQVTSPTARQTAGTLRKAIIRFFVNGLETPAFLSTDDVVNATATVAFPTAFMSPWLAIENQAGSSPGTVSIDWMRIGQRANT